MFSHYKLNELENGLNRLGINRLDVLFTGVTGAGKSTTLNALLGANAAKVGEGVDPETQDISVYKMNDKFFIWDSPGLGDGVQNDKRHAKKIVDLLYKNYSHERYRWIDEVIVIIEGINRDMGTTYKLLNEVVVPNFPSDRLLVAINQSDVAMSGRHWVPEKRQPDAILENFMEDFAFSLQRRIKEATGVTILKPVYYSALHNYNLDVFMDFIIKHIPDKLVRVTEK